MKRKVLILGYSFLVFSLKRDSISVKRMHLVAAVNIVNSKISLPIFFFVKLRGFQCLAFLLIPHIPILCPAVHLLCGAIIALMGARVSHQTTVTIVKHKQEHKLRPRASWHEAPSVFTEVSCESTGHW